MLILNDITYSGDIENIILSHLDGWVIQKTTGDDTDDLSTEVTAFMTSDELKNKANKVITGTECQLCYEETLDSALLYCNRLNVDDLNRIELRAFIRAVCKWTASNLWNKYNIRVNNEDLEDTYVQSYGGLLYHSAMKALQPFINQRITGYSKITDNDDADKDLWII